MSTTSGEFHHLVPADNIVVTGGAGYIGSHLVDLLAEAGHRVTVIDNLASGSTANLATRLQRDDIRLVTGSILDAELLSREFRSADLVFHLAAAVGVGRIVADPLASLRTNVGGTEQVLDACARHDCAVVLASSSEVYGKDPAFPMSESGDRTLGPTTVPRWSYAAAKAVDEHLALAYAASGLRASAVRYFNSYGPRIDRRGSASVVAVFLRQAFAGEPITLHGDGGQSRCFTYVSDTVQGTLAAAAPAAQGQVFNIGSPAEITVAELAQLIVSETGSRSPIARTPYQAVYGDRFEDVRRRVPDVSLAREVLGWEPEVTLADGLKRTIAWWSEQPGLAEAAAGSAGSGRGESGG
jgi:UDP-glucose 4-epimerase